MTRKKRKIKIKRRIKRKTEIKRKKVKKNIHPMILMTIPMTVIPIVQFPEIGIEKAKRKARRSRKKKTDTSKKRNRFLREKHQQQTILIISKQFQFYLPK